MTNWKEVKYLRQGESFNYDYTLLLPEPLANWDVFDYWERERVESMKNNLTKDDILFDVGVEMGWLSIVYANFCKIFLIEPTVEFWPNIHQIWLKNRKENPIGCFNGLIGSKSKFNYILSEYQWPEAINGDLIDKNKYQYLDNTENLPVISIDDLVKYSRIKPTALTIDIEGYELFALQGAKKLLTKNNIKVWLSIHPDLMENNSNKVEDIFSLMETYGYSGEKLSVDHEEHWRFYKK